MTRPGKKIDVRGNRSACIARNLVFVNGFQMRGIRDELRISWSPLGAIKVWSQKIRIIEPSFVSFNWAWPQDADLKGSLYISKKNSMQKIHSNFLRSNKNLDILLSKTWKSQSKNLGVYCRKTSKNEAWALLFMKRHLWWPDLEMSRLCLGGPLWHVCSCCIYDQTFLRISGKQKASVPCAPNWCVSWGLESGQNPCHIHCMSGVWVWGGPCWCGS